MNKWFGGTKKNIRCMFFFENKKVSVAVSNLGQRFTVECQKVTSEMLNSDKI